MRARFVRLFTILLICVLIPAAMARAERLRFVACGDFRGAHPDEPLNAVIVSEIVARILALSPRPAFVLSSGDLITRAKHNDEWQYSHWFKAIKPLTDAGIPVYTAVGNHELYQKERGVLFRESQERYQKEFSFLPQNGPKDYEGLVYSLTSPGGDAFFAVLDTYYIAPDQQSIPYVNHGSAITQAQLDWLSAQIKASKARFKFAMMHAPTYDPMDAAQPPCKEPGHCALWRMLEQNRFAMSIYGHLHLYARKKIDASFDPAYVHGVTEVITGGGGAPLDKKAKVKADLADWKINDAYNYLVVDIDGDTLTAVAMGKVDGQWREIDRFALTAGQ